MTGYARRLGLFSGTMAVVGGIIGGGIFRTPAAVAERAGSVGLTLAVWITGGVVALAGAFCFGELGARRPRAGGGYVYLRETFGPLPAFLYGWTLLLVIATGAIAAVAVLFADYALALLGLPDGWKLPGRRGQRGRAVGRQLSRRASRAPLTQNLFTVLKLLALALLVGVGLALGVPAVAAAARAGRARHRDRSLRSGPGAGALHVRGLAADQLHRRGDRRARAHPAPRAGARGGDRGDGVSLGQPRLPPGPWPRRPGDQYRAGGRGDGATAGTARGQRDRRRHRGLLLRLPQPGDPGDARASSRRWPPTASFSPVWPGCTRSTRPRPPPSCSRPAWAILLILSGSFAQLVDYVTFGDWIFFGLTVAGLFVYRRRDRGAPATGFRTPGLPVHSRALRARRRLRGGERDRRQSPERHAGQPADRAGRAGLRLLGPTRPTREDLPWMKR